MPKIKVLIEGGKATAAAPLGPALGPLGVNIPLIVNEINEKTKQFIGIKVPVEIEIDSSKNFTLNIGLPPTSALIIKEANIQKGAANQEKSAGNITIEQIKSIAQSKMQELTSYTLKSAIKEIVGTCNSMGITINNKKASYIIKEIEKGTYNKILE